MSEETNLDKILSSGIRRAKHADGSEVEYHAPADNLKAKQALSSKISSNGLFFVNGVSPKIDYFDDD